MADKGNVTVTFTATQVEALHDALSMIQNDPDWAEMLGGQRQMAKISRAHSRLLTAWRETLNP